MTVGLAQADKIFYSAAPAASGNCRWSMSAPRPAATASTARPWPQPSSTKTPRNPSAPQSRSAIPFTEKLLIEATLELMASGAVAAIQDMGAAGLTSSSVEMAGKGGVGIELNMDAVPQREEGMTALR